MYALTGCDSVSFSVLHGQAQGSKVVQNYKLELDSVLGNVETSYESALIKKVLNFFVTCMVASRLCQWTYWGLKFAKSLRQLQRYVPPADPGSEQHLLRAHLQLILWKSALSRSPPEVQLTSYGWHSYLTRSGVKEIVPLVIACECKSEKSCSNKMCSCFASIFGCTPYSKCSSGDIVWHNPIMIKLWVKKPLRRTTKKMTKLCFKLYRTFHTIMVFCYSTSIVTRLNF